MVESVEKILLELGLKKYTEVFLEQEITIESFPHLQDEDLRELGLPLGPRKVLLAEISRRQGENPVSASPSTPISPNEAERRQITILFCDLVGSTKIASERDPEEVRDILLKYHQTVVQSVQRYGGYVAKNLGDGVLAYFGWPNASENQAGSAIGSSLLSVKSVQDIKIDGDISLSTRIGIASGEVVIGDLVAEGTIDAGNVVGETPNLAARLQAIAEPNEVVVDNATRELCGGSFDMSDFGMHDLKGFDEPIQAWRVTGEKASNSRFETNQPKSVLPFVGRSRELELLLDRWKLASTNKGQLAFLSGEAGIGKSRFVLELREHVKTDEHVSIFYQCSPHHEASSLYPVIQQIQRSARIEQDDNSETRLEKLKDLLVRNTPKQLQKLPILAELMSLSGGSGGMSSQKQRDLTIGMIVEHIVELSTKKPVLLVVEDAHWIDPTTELLVGELARETRNHSVLILVTHRTGFEPEWQTDVEPVQILLSKLTQREGQEIIRASGGTHFSSRIMEEIANRADGVPLFVEEITKSMLENASLDSIPTSIHSLLTSRIDRLGPAKQIAQVASVLGSKFDRDLLMQVGAFSEDMLNLSIAYMLEAGLLKQDKFQAGETFQFRHSLIQDAAYETLLKSTRRSYHKRTAEVLLERTADEMSDEPELIAWHYSRAGLPAESVPYWLIAGQRHGLQSAHREAVANLQAGLEDLEKLAPSNSRDGHEFALRIALGASLITTESWSSPAVAENYSRAQELGETVNDSGKLFIALRGQANVSFLNGHVSKTREIVDLLIDIARGQNDSGLLLEAYRSAGMCELFTGDFEAAEKFLRQADSIYDRDSHHSLAQVYGTDPAVVGNVALGWTYWFQGNPREAEKHSTISLELAETLDHPFSIAYAQCLTASLLQFGRDAKGALAMAKRAIATADEHEYPYWTGWANIMLGWAIAVNGKAQKGIDTLKRGSEIYQDTGARQITPYVLTLLAEMHGLAGDPQTGLTVLSPVLDGELDIDVRFFEAETYRIAGWLAHLCDNEADTFKYLSQSLVVARVQKAELLELRTVASLIEFGAASPELRDGKESILAMCKSIDPDGKIHDVKRVLDQLKNL